jgi:hypothetical protein
MSSVETEPSAAVSTRTAMRIVGASVGLLTLAGVLMWWRYGPAIFFDVLSSLQNCF